MSSPPTGSESGVLAVAMNRRFSRRAFLGVTASSLLLTGCIVETPERGPVVPTPTLSTLGALSAVVAGPAGRWENRTLRIVASGDDIREYLRLVLWEPFAAATGCQLELGYPEFESLDRGDADVDLALISDQWATLLGTGDALMRLEPVGNDGTFPDLIQATATGIPAYGNAIISAYRRDAVTIDSVPVDWVDWWQSRTRPGNRTLAKGPHGTFEFALLADDVPPAELYPLDLERAIAGLRRISGTIVDRWWETGPQAIDWLGSGRAAFGSAMGHQVVQAQRSGRPVQPIWNQGLLVADFWVIPSGSDNADVAADFLGFALTADAQAALAMASGLAPVSSVGLRGVDPLLVANLATGPVNLPRLIRSDTQWWVDNQTAANEAFNSWLLGDPRARD